MAGRRQFSSLRAERSNPDFESGGENRVVNGLLRRIAPRNGGGGGVHDEVLAFNTPPSCSLPFWFARDPGFSRSCPAHAQNSCAPARTGKTGSPAPCASAAGSAPRTAPCPLRSCAARTRGGRLHSRRAPPAAASSAP